ncbi:hypothetical protein JYQ79_03205, partial [Anaerobutyricum hallii]|uniref:hypothetical protein n=1 Tax=Anaerobutyricum hallii TaxID=39488 RepID=UPI001ADDD7E4
ATIGGIKMLPDIQPGNTKILYFFNCLLDGMHTRTPLVVSYVDTIGGGFLVKNGIYRNEFVFR